MYRQSGKNLLNSNTTSTCPHNMVNFGLLTAEACWRVWGIPANFNGFCVLAALLHGTLVVGVSQTLWRWTEVATYIRQGGHRVGRWPTFLVWETLWTKQQFCVTSFLRFRYIIQSFSIYTCFICFVTDVVHLSSCDVSVQIGKCVILCIRCSLMQWS